jgi:hypothetical protein
VRFQFDPAPALETLMLHFCGEMRLTQWYRRAAEWHTEPLIRHIYGVLSSDEARHASCYMRYMKRALERLGDEARRAFAKIGVLMTNTRTSRALHPTNLHVNKEFYPRDTVQSRLPDPGWLERWLDEQIRFDEAWENKVTGSILRKLSNLFEVPLLDAKDLRSYRKQLTAASEAA